MHDRRFGGDFERLRLPGRVGRLEVERVTALCLDGIVDASVLDVGTGTGLFAEGFAKKGCYVEAVDANPEMVAAAERTVSGVKFLAATAESLPYGRSTFDVVFLGLVLHECDDALAALNEAVRVARVRAAVLEWPYREEEFGPPLAHRIDPALFQGWVAEIAPRDYRTIELTNLVLHLLEV